MNKKIRQSIIIIAILIAMFMFPNIINAVEIDNSTPIERK